MPSNRPTRTAVLLACWAAACLAGCDEQKNRARRLEMNGQEYLAYEIYRKAAEARHDDGGAIDGMRRTAEATVEHWRGRAKAAAEKGDWQRAALCHLKVLQVRPDEPRSLLALKKLEREHPDEVEAAHKDLTSGRVTRELLALALAEEAGPTREASRPPATGPAATQPAEPPATQPKHPAPAGPVVARRHQARKSVPRTRPAGGPVRPVEITRVPRSTGRRRTTAPPVRSRPRPPDPKKQKPSVRWEPGAGRSEMLKQVRISRDDDRYPKLAALEAGLSVKVEDTDGKPLDADLSVYLGGRKIGEFEDLPVDSVIELVNAAGQWRELVVIAIEDDDETVTVGLRESTLHRPKSRR